MCIYEAFISLHGVDSLRGESISGYKDGERWTPVKRHFWPDFAFRISRGSGALG